MKETEAMKYTIIDDVNKINKKKWEGFINKHPNGNIFQSYEIYQIFKGTKKYTPAVVCVMQNDEIVGIQVSTVIKIYDNLLSFLTARSIVFGGPVILDNNPEILEVLTKAYKSLIKRKAIYSEYRNMWDWSDLKVTFEKAGATYIEHLDILVDINKTEEEIFGSINAKARNKVRKGIKSGLEFMTTSSPTTEELNQIYTILEEIYLNAQLPLVDKSLFENSSSELSEENKIMFFCAKKDDKIVGVRIGLPFKELLYDWYAGSLREYYKFCPNDFLTFKTMAWGHNNGYKVFDFGGAGKPNVPYGVRDYKLKFGGDLVNFGRFEIMHKPFLMKVASTGFKIKQKIFQKK